MSASVILKDVSCIFQGTGKAAREVRAVDGVNLEIKPGEFFTLLGPSGSGKTTCLRMIGGFTLPTAGTILIDGQDVSQLAPFERPVNTVFQDYALFPHMSIVQNVAYGLMVKGMPEQERTQKANEMLELVALSDVGNRRPAQLSGGQRQRVALARALVNQPKVLLLDEPLGALDLKLREQMQSELKTLQRRLGITFLFITHDQHEALAMSDRVGVFNQGKLVQVDTPFALYESPKTRFVAQFLGAANILDGECSQALTRTSMCMLRPERIVPVQDTQGKVSGVVRDIQYFGAFARIKVQLDHSDSARGVVNGEAIHMTADVPGFDGKLIPTLNQRTGLNWDESAVHPLKSH